MKPANRSILAINGGSSSIKFSLYATQPALHASVAGQIGGIGGSAPVFSAEGVDPSDNFSRRVAANDQAAAAGMLIDWISERIGAGALVGAGHRIVHGGPKYHAPRRITPALLRDLRRLQLFDPDHLPGEILLAVAVQRRFPRLPQIACFDTAFHHGMPRVAQIIAIPRKYEAKGVRRYGFHGLSYEFLMGELGRVAGPAAARGKIILAHLGSGASLAAVRGGKPVDTTMGFSPASGVPMATRSGDLDPGLVRFLARTERMGAAAFNEMANARSGLLGVSETSSDMRDLLRREAGDARAAEAVALFCYQVAKSIGSFAAALGGIDALVFAGGIGENSPVVRARICAGLDFLGIGLDTAKNRANAGVISPKASPVTVRVIRTDEEIVIAQAVCRALGLSRSKRGSNP